MKIKGHKISSVEANSIAEEIQVQAGDLLLKINGEEMEDIFDYRYLMNEEFVVLEVEKTNGEIWELEVEKEYEEDLGITFEKDLMDDYRSCSNHCIFCFIDQMPPGMRDTLYFKDDDSRLSFIQGNYVTLTNMSDHDIDRIIRYHLEPINISIQTMNPELRCKMLHNRFILKAEQGSRLLAAIDGINDKQLVRARHILRQLDSQRPAVDDLHRVGECIVMVQILSYTDAETFILQDDIADAQDRHFCRMQDVIET